MGSYNHFYMGSYGDGDLEAVVRGCSSSTPIDKIENNCLDEFVFDSYPRFFETETLSDELEAIYKPFYPTMEHYSPHSIMTTSSASLSFGEIEAQEQKPSFACESLVACANHEVTKYKRRKNQQKRVVMQVKEENLSSDKWAWRKYGQKPIKGSPYPRSYYRCSSSKGCMARKQVERSLSDPQTFIITYTADHCHPYPTRRNSLAGTTRNKFPKCHSPNTMNIITNEPSDTSSPSPKNDNNSPIENIYQQEIKSEEEENWQKFGEMVLRDDFVVGFDQMSMGNYEVDYSGRIDTVENMNWFGV